MKVLCKELVGSNVKIKTHDTGTTNDEHNILCLLCNNLITNQNNQIIINQSHKHVFANPHGIVFEIGCFKEAFGCTTLHESSNEFSWFSGFRWQIAVCRSCSNHLGWYFTKSSNFFFGLILEKLYFN